jgi:hypothetical protein
VANKFVVLNRNRVLSTVTQKEDVMCSTLQASYVLPKTNPQSYRKITNFQCYQKLQDKRVDKLSISTMVWFHK